MKSSNNAAMAALDPSYSQHSAIISHNQTETSDYSENYNDSEIQSVMLVTTTDC